LIFELKEYQDKIKQNPQNPNIFYFLSSSTTTEGERVKEERKFKGQERRRRQRTYLNK
jgi:hypothetical protein